ncbi:MAG: hypothetical protein IT178_18785 [Acidobacteria bacterium]|nr:hypothetical protein [Acidobacteriota bacterium]
MMSPDSFHFTVTVPGDPRLVGVVRDLCAHAAGYARLSSEAAAALAARVSAAAEEATAGRHDVMCPLDFACDAGELRVTVAGQTITQPLGV